MCLCKKCLKMSGALLFVVGLLYLGQDLGWWSFWKISWWTAVFIMYGLGSCCAAGCPDCQATCCDMPAKGKKK